MMITNPNLKEKRFDIQDDSAIDVNCIETFPYQYTGKRLDITISTNEFTAVCPWSGLPDFATLTIKYVPNKVCIELKSLKYYIHSYRNVGMFQEHITQRILDDLVKVSDPIEMTIILDYNIRGGLHTITEASYKKNESK